MDINIQGPGVAAQHCYIENRSGVITLHPCGNLCAIDGVQVKQQTRLSQGRKWVLGVRVGVLKGNVHHVQVVHHSSDRGKTITHTHTHC